MSIHPAAQKLAASTIDGGDRILIIGATGWFGKTAIQILANVNHEGLLAYSSREGRLVSNGKVSNVSAWNIKDVAEFSPTVVLNFAFLTREKWSPENDDAYRHANKKLTQQLIAAVELRSVRAALTVSSGAVNDADLEMNPYGLLKLEESNQLLSLTSSKRSCLVAEAWSLSGSFVRKPSSYLFSDLIKQSLSGKIQITSNHLVYRRYTLVEDYLSVCLNSLRAGWSGRIQSGGELVEAGGLAETIAHYAPFRVRVERPDLVDAHSDHYHSNNSEWLQHASQARLQPADLDEQVRLVGRALGWQ